MEHTGHVMLVGDGASNFGQLMGFPKENLLTEPLAQDVATVARDHVHRRLVGPRPRQPELQVS